MYLAQSRSYTQEVYSTPSSLVHNAGVSTASPSSPCASCPTPTTVSNYPEPLQKIWNMSSCSRRHWLKSCTTKEQLVPSGEALDTICQKCPAETRGDCRESSSSLQNAGNLTRSGGPKALNSRNRNSCIQTEARRHQTQGARKWTKMQDQRKRVEKSRIQRQSARTAGTSHSNYLDYSLPKSWQPCALLLPRRS